MHDNSYLNFRLLGMTLLEHLMCIIKSTGYINKPLVYKDEIKERRRIIKND